MPNPVPPDDLEAILSLSGEQAWNILKNLYPESNMAGFAHMIAAIPMPALKCDFLATCEEHDTDPAMWPMWERAYAYVKSQYRQN